MASIDLFNATSSSTSALLYGFSRDRRSCHSASFRFVSVSAVSTPVGIMSWLHRIARDLIMFSPLHLVSPCQSLRFIFDTIKSTVVLAYDTLLNSSREVELIWKHRPFFRLGTVLYQMLRYPTILVLTLDLYLDLANTSTMVCSTVTYLKWTST
jgi:hypothetical protein